MYNPQRVILVATVLYCIMLLALSCVLRLWLSCLLDRIARISNCNSIQMSIRLITEGSDWPAYNLIVQSKGKGPRVIGQSA